MTKRIIRTLPGLLATCALVVGAATTAHATTTAGAATAKGSCGATATEPIAPGLGVAATPPSAAEIAAVGQYKAQHNRYEAQMPGLMAQEAAQRAQKLADLRTTGTQTRASACAATPATALTVRPATAIARLVQYGQIKNWYCGPATVAEMSATVPGPSPVGLDQNALASYMGTTQSAGTTYTGLVNGLNHYVGVPDFGRNYYAFVWISDIPTSAQRSTFMSDLQTDVSQNSPIAGNGWEVPGGPHMTGHPANEEIFHIFEIGGYNSSQVYYADSATTVWSSVPAYSWFDTYTMVTILGGRGYAW
jgi:hypothetical protein